MKSRAVILILRGKNIIVLLLHRWKSRRWHFRSFRSKLWSNASAQFCNF